METFYDPNVPKSPPRISYAAKDDDSLVESVNILSSSPTTANSEKAKS
jgi:hypothetical protein